MPMHGGREDDGASCRADGSMSSGAEGDGDTIDAIDRSTVGDVGV